MALLLRSALRPSLARMRPALTTTRWLSAAPDDPESEEERMDELLELSSVCAQPAAPVASHSEPCQA